MNRKVISYLNDAIKAGTPAALAVLTESGRDTPGVPGAMMAIRIDGGKMGTLGGGKAEAKVIEESERALRAGTPQVFSFDYSLKKDGGLGMVCGGNMRGYVTVISPAQRLIVFGGGHVGKKIYKAGVIAGFDVKVVEDREEYAAAFPRENVYFAKDFSSAADKLNINENCYVVIVTRGHSQDFSVLLRVVKSDAAYIGMIGSRKKVADILQRLRDKGIDENAIAAIYTPIGIDIDNGTPGEIAIGVLAEILAVKNKRNLKHRKNNNS